MVNYLRVFAFAFTFALGFAATFAFGFGKLFFYSTTA
jgi:hypothetical protein